ncbi:hypothetical protein [Spongiactinospora sp. 9N601]|uniref:hypothetical protein n=1 Tax=Spongiactinospora sp. 9N601 TaxID=3375149 RepID=UPI0037BD37C1
MGRWERLAMPGGQQARAVQAGGAPGPLEAAGVLVAEAAGAGKAPAALGAEAPLAQMGQVRRVPVVPGVEVQRAAAVPAGDGPGAGRSSPDG